MTEPVAMTELVRSRVGDDNDGALTGQQNAPVGLQRFRVEGREALVENKQFSTLQQRTGKIDPAALPVRQLPSGFADNPMQPVRHTLKHRSEFEVAQNLLSHGQIFVARRPAAPISTLNASVPDRIWFS